MMQFSPHYFPLRLEEISRKLKFSFLENKNMTAVCWSKAQPSDSISKIPNWCATFMLNRNYGWELPMLDKLIGGRSCCWRKIGDAVEENLYWMHPHICTAAIHSSQYPPFKWFCVYRLKWSKAISVGLEISVSTYSLSTALWVGPNPQV